MKKSILLLMVFLLLGIPAAVLAQSDTGTLPDLMEPVPDPAIILGSVGGPYQQNFIYGNSVYNTYLYPKPESTEAFISAYTEAAQSAGYLTAPDRLENNDMLNICEPGTPVCTMLLYDYQGYMFLMVPVEMNFVLGLELAELPDVPQLVQLGQDAIARGDYQTAIRYLIRAAGSYIQPQVQTAPQEASTPEVGEDGIYTVQADDTCWSIAVDKFHVNFELFVRMNGDIDCAALKPGDEVFIPGADQEMPTSVPILLDQYAMGQRIQYVVEMDDSYNSIAAKFNTTLTSIQQLNNVNVYTTFPEYGQVLTIAVNLVTPTPAPVTEETPAP